MKFATYLLVRGQNDPDVLPISRFEYIFHSTGLTEGEVIKVMRKKLKHKSFKNWRKRANGRKSKHRKLNELRDD